MPDFPRLLLRLLQDSWLGETVGSADYLFHHGIYRHVDEWENAARAPVAARLAASVSLIAWTGMIFAGRLLAYT